MSNTTVYIWTPPALFNGSILDGLIGNFVELISGKSNSYNPGHSAIEFSSKYVSFYPPKSSNATQKFIKSPVLSRFKSLDEEIEEKGSPEWKFVLPHLNTKSMMKLWKDMTKNGGYKYNLLSKNCCNVVFDFLVEGIETSKYWKTLDHFHTDLFCGGLSEVMEKVRFIDDLFDDHLSEDEQHKLYDELPDFSEIYTHMRIENTFAIDPFRHAWTPLKENKYMKDPFYILFLCYVLKAYNLRVDNF